MTELALEPVRELASRPFLAAVSLRTPSGGRRYTITIGKRFLDGANNPEQYIWSIVEIADSGEPIPEGRSAESTSEETWSDPEAAYWAAVSGLCAIGG